MIIKIDGVEGNPNDLAEGGHPFSEELAAAMEASWQFPDGELYLASIIRIMGRGEIVWDGTPPDDPPGTIY